MKAIAARAPNNFFYRTSPAGKIWTSVRFGSRADLKNIGDCDAAVVVGSDSQARTETDGNE